MVALWHQGLIILGSALFVLPGDVEFFFPQSRPYLDPIVVHLSGLRWIQDVGFYGFLFLATFLAWKKQRDDVEEFQKDDVRPRLEAVENQLRDLQSASQSGEAPAYQINIAQEVSRLKAESEAIRAHSWGFFGVTQKKGLVEALKIVALAQTSSRYIGVQIFYVRSPDCLSLARSLHECFIEARWSAMFMDGPEGQSKDGIWVNGPPPPHQPHRKLIADVLRQGLGDDGRFVYEADLKSGLNDLLNQRIRIVIAIGPKPHH